MKKELKFTALFTTCVLLTACDPTFKKPDSTSYVKVSESGFDLFKDENIPGSIQATGFNNVFVKNSNGDGFTFVMVSIHSAPSARTSPDFPALQETHAGIIFDTESLFSLLVIIILPSNLSFAFVTQALMNRIMYKIKRNSIKPVNHNGRKKVKIH